MQAIDYIQRHGFKRWYERQLIESHAYLALGFVALILMLSGFEVMGEMKSGLGYVSILGMAALGGVLMLVAWRRFNVLLARAERFAEGATCPTCNDLGQVSRAGPGGCARRRPPGSRPPALAARALRASAAEWV